jgi:hypothetical protein
MTLQICMGVGCPEIFLVPVPSGAQVGPCWAVGGRTMPEIGVSEGAA